VNSGSVCALTTTAAGACAMRESPKVTPVTARPEISA
jgi:hypothetical protein